jgi:hypothetical protein
VEDQEGEDELEGEACDDDAPGEGAAVEGEGPSEGDEGDESKERLHDEARSEEEKVQLS